MNNKQLDSYSLLITSKYFKTPQDYINIICVNSKFKETTEKLRFNPIPIESLKLFPKIQTQYLYSENDVKIDGIDNYEIWYKVTYDQYLEFKKDNVEYHDVVT
ncbi:Leucine rich repeat containing protein BspA family protein [Entamoeba marina]